MVRQCILAGLLCCITTLGYAQTRTIDSLEQLIRNVPADTTRVGLLNRLVTVMRDMDNNKALSFAQQAFDLSELLNYGSGKAVALENLGWIYYRRGDFSKAFDLSHQAFKLAEEHGNRSAVARCLNNLAAIRFEQKQYESAIEYFRKAYRIARGIQDMKTITRSLNNIGYCYYRLKKLDSASYYAEKSLRLSEESNNYYHASFAMRTLGDIEFDRENTEKALSLYKSTLDYAERVDNNFLVVSTLHRIGNAYAKLNNLNQALAHLNKNITLAMRLGYKDELERSYKVISELYEQRGDFRKAYEYQSRYLSLHDSLYSQRAAEQMALLQATLDSELKQAQINLLTKDTQLKQEEINNQRIWMYFFIGCVSLLIILAFVLLYNNQIRRKANRTLAAKNVEIQLQAHQLANLNLTKDKLFSIISHDLRSPLASLRGLINLIVSGDLTQEEFAEVAKKLKRNLDSVNDDLDNLLLWAQSQLRGLQVEQRAVNLKPLIDQKINLYGEDARNKNITILNEIEDDVTVLADQNHLGLVIRNLLVNAIKFNKNGGMILIRQKEAGEFLEISVTDSGVGMSLHDVKKLFHSDTHFTHLGTNMEKGSGIGLLLTKEFVEKNGGTIWVTSELGKGSTFTFTLKREFSWVGEEVKS